MASKADIEMVSLREKGELITSNQGHAGIQQRTVNMNNERKLDKTVRCQMVSPLSLICLLCAGLVGVTVYNSLVLHLPKSDNCESSPCLHGGLCIDGVNTYQCVCLMGYTGQHCDQDIDDCAVNQCLNGGSCTDNGTESFTCECLTGYTGRVCEALEEMLDCHDVYQSGRSVSGVYELTRLSDIGVNTRYQAYCDMDVSNDTGGWTVLIRRQNGQTDFKRDWAEYEEGFGDLNQEYWIGNEAMHQITANNGRTYRVRVDMVTADNVTFWAEYAYFYVGGNSTEYTLNVARPYSGTAEDMLMYHNDCKFSTRDKDNDGSTTHCAKKYGAAGWWFNSCFNVVLTGPYGQELYNNVEGINWKHNGQWLDLRYAVLKVKPTLCMMV